STTSKHPSGRVMKSLLVFIVLAIVSAVGVLRYLRGSADPRPGVPQRLAYQERRAMDTGGFNAVLQMLKPWPPSASLQEIADAFRRVGYRDIDQLDRSLARPELPDQRKIVLLLMKAALFNYEGEPNRAYRVLDEARSWLESRDALAEQWLYGVIYFQGVTA